MVFPIPDQKKISVSNTSYDGSSTYELKAVRKPLAILEATISWDSNFESNGEYRASLKGREFSSENVPKGSYAPFEQGLTFPFRNIPVILHPGEAFTVEGKISTGSGTLFIQTIAVELTPEEASAYMERFGLNG